MGSEPREARLLLARVERLRRELRGRVAAMEAAPTVTLRDIETLEARERDLRDHEESLRSAVQRDGPLLAPAR